MYIESDGFIGGVQMTLTHNDNFKIEMTNKALFSDYLTLDNETRLLVVTPESDHLFNYNGQFEITEIIVANSQHEIPVNLSIVSSFNLSEAYPNPFNPSTTLVLDQKVAGNVMVYIYNIYGQIVNTLISGYRETGTYDLTWDASCVPSGIYFVKAESAQHIQTQKIMLIK